MNVTFDLNNASLSTGTKTIKSAVIKAALDADVYLSASVWENRAIQPTIENIQSKIDLHALIKSLLINL